MHDAAEPPTDVIIGAASGIGAAVAPLLAGRGRRLLLADLAADTDRVACDISDPAAVAALVERVPRLGALVLTAGLSPSMADGRRIWDVDLVAVDRLLTAFEPTLGPGSVAVVTASMAAHMVTVTPEWAAVLDDPTSPTLFADLAALGLDPDSPELAYALAKHGVVRMVARRAPAWGARGARLVSVSPGIVDTPMGRQEAAHEPSMAGMVEAAPLGRRARPEEVAAAIAFLASDDASFITGIDLLVDGGLIAKMDLPVR